MTENMIVVESDPRFNFWKEYHLGIQISKSLIERLHPEIVAEDETTYRSQVGELGWSLMKKLHSLSGVSEMYFYTHSVTVYGAENVDWSLLGPKILEVLKQVLQIKHPEIEEVLSQYISPDHFHIDDSARPSFVMPQ